MNRKGQQPKLFGAVLQAIVNSKEAEGSTANQIINVVHEGLEPVKIPRPVVVQVHAALRYAIESGVVNHRRGRYQSNVTKNDIRKIINNGIEKITTFFGKIKGRPSLPQRKQPMRECSEARNSDRYSNASSTTASLCSSAGTSLRSCRRRGRPRRRFSSKETTDSERKRQPPKKKVQQTKQKKGGKKRQAKRANKSANKSAKNSGPTQPKPRGRPRKQPPKPSNDEAINDNSAIADTMQVDNDQVVDTGPECSNLDCLCNLKREPNDDV